MHRSLSWLIFGMILLLCGLTGWGWYQWKALQDRAATTSWTWSDQDPVVIPDSVPIPGRDSLDRWWSSGPFRMDRFRRPYSQDRPWVRWWWPHLDVAPLELQREIQSFDEQGFGGISVSLTHAGLSPDDQSTYSAARLSPDAPRLRYLLRTVLQAAHKRGMALDWMSPWGMPMGSPYLAPEEQLQTLAFGEAHILGGKRIDIPLPLPELPASYYLSSYVSEAYVQGPPIQTLPLAHAQRVVVFAIKVRDNQRNPLPLVLTDYMALEPDSMLTLNTFVTADHRLQWLAPPGYWEILVVYHLPTGQRQLWGAHQQMGGIVDVFNPDVVEKEVRRMTGQWVSDTLPAIAGSWRGLSFSAPFWLAEEAFSPTLLDSFASQAGYDLLPWLPALSIPGNTHALMNRATPQRVPAYRLSDQDARVRADVARVRSDFLIEQGLSRAVHVSNALGRVHRGRPYGLDWDIIRAAGTTQIPTASQAYAGGSELFLKQISSGGMLYGRPLIAADALAHDGLAGAMTPARAKLAVDKLFSAGFNHIEWQGYAYHWQDSATYGAQGWHPFQTRYFKGGKFSTQLGETSLLWSHWPALNEYVARCQYLLRQGKPATDILVYYPFLGFPSVWADEQAYEEPYFNGMIPGSGDTTSHIWQEWPMTHWPRDSSDSRIVWLRKVRPILRALESMGYSWAWVNDDLLQQARVEGQQLYVKEQAAGMIFLPEIEAIPLRSIEQIVEVARAGAAVWLYGESPSRQPGYLNYRSHDSLIQVLTREVQLSLNPEGIQDLRNLLRADPPTQGVAYAGYYPFLRSQRRILPDSSELVWLQNTEGKDRFFELTIQEDFDHLYWLDPTTGACYPATRKHLDRVVGFLSSYTTRILYAKHGGALSDSLIRQPTLQIDGPSLRNKLNEITLDRWQFIATDDRLSGQQVFFDDTNLFDWRETKPLRYYVGEGLYTTTFDLANALVNRQFLLDLGEVGHVADVRVNTVDLNTLAFPPYQLDLTPYLVPGANTLEIWVRPPLRNAWVGAGKSGEAAYLPYSQFPLLPAGLLGPVRLIELQE